MLKRLRRILTSAPVVGGVAALLLYLALGFLALPALLKWQLPKQVAAQLDHRLQIGELRFDPLKFRLEADDLALSDAGGSLLFGLRQLQIDFELRSLIDRAWTFSLLRLEAPELHFELQDDGRHNFSALLDRLAGDTTAEPAPPSGELPRIVLTRGELVEGRIDFSDRQLDDPLITRVESLNLTLDGLGTEAGGHFQVNARSADGETLDGDGRLALADPAAVGRLALKGLQVSTLARALSRLVRIDSPAGTLGLDARFELGLAAGAPAGTVHDIVFSGDEVSIGVAGSELPLFAARSVALDKASVDLGRREVRLAGLSLSDGSVAASLDAGGRPNWAKLTQARPAVLASVQAAAPSAAPVASAASASGPASAGTRPVAASAPTAATSTASAAVASVVSTAPAAPAASAAAVAAAAGVDAAASAPAWRIVLPQARLSGFKLDFADAAAGRRLAIGRVDGEVSAQVDTGPAGLTLDAEQPRLTLAGLRLDEPTQAMSAPTLTLGAGRARLDAAQALDLTLDAPEIALPEGLTLELAGGGVELAATSIQAGPVALKLGGARLDARVDGPRLRSDRVAWQGGGHSAEVGALSLQVQGLTLNQDGERLTASLDAPRWSTGPIGWGSPDGAAELASLSLQAGRIQLDRSGAQLQGEAETVRIAADGAGWRTTGSDLKLAQATLESTRMGAVGTLDGFKADAEKTSVSMSGFGFQQDGAKVELAQGSASGTTLSLAQDAGRIRIEGRGAELGASGLVADQGADRVGLQDARLGAATWRAALPPADGDGAGLEAGVEMAALQMTALDVRALGAASTLARLGGARIGAGSLQLNLADGAPDVRGDGLDAELSALQLQDPADAAELLRLASATLAGGALRLQQRSLRADRLALSDGSVRTWIDAEGRVNWTALAGAPPAASAPSAGRVPVDAGSAAPPASSAADTPWALALGELQIDSVSAGFEDRRQSPAFALAFDAVNARAKGFDTASAQPMAIELDARVASGGELGARGSVAADGSRADLQLRVAGLALAPLQPYLAKFAALRLAGGSASAEGRLRHGDPATAGAALVYEGSASVDGLQLDEAAADRVFLSWGSVATDDMALTWGPGRIDIGELRVDKPTGRLIIAEDQSINVTDVLKRPTAEPDAAAADEAKSADAAAAEPLALSIARVRVADGELDFADLSLRPQFRARMHDLKGVINGLSSDPERAATVQLDAHVDRYGDAKISGQLSLLRPEQLTDIEMAFRNLEMTSLSPYIVKFAGYRIAGGRLALDLRYQVRDSKLKGENKIVVKQLELGEKVESPDALDLPLELAVAILKDANGVIDIGLPVSGDLGSPEFDVGAVVGKAIGGLLGGIVSAPFRALGAVFGGGEKALDSIDFAPGRSALAPPERGKLDTLSRALQARPTLKLIVPPTYDSGLDRPALKSLAVRSEIVRRMGVKLADEDDPGALDVDNPRVQRAIEEALGDRYAPEVVAALKRRAGEAVAPTASAAPASAASAPAAVVPLPASFYRGLLDRMINETEVPTPRLAALAASRGQAIVDELTAAGGVPATRVALGRTQEGGQVAAGEARAVQLHLELGAVE